MASEVTSNPDLLQHLLRPVKTWTKQDRWRSIATDVIFVMGKKYMWLPVWMRLLANKRRFKVSWKSLPGKGEVIYWGLQYSQTKNPYLKKWYHVYVWCVLWQILQGNRNFGAWATVPMITGLLFPYDKPVNGLAGYFLHLKLGKSALLPPSLSCASPTSVIGTSNIGGVAV